MAVLDSQRDGDERKLAATARGPVSGHAPTMIESSARQAYGLLAERLRAFVARRVAPSEVDDVVQDVFVRMLRGVDGLRDEERFGPWLYQVARHAIADSQRARARHPLARDADGPAERLADLGMPVELDEDAEPPDVRLGKAAAALVELLPSPYREALTLVDVEGLSHKVAAQRTGISLSGMKSRVQRGRARLRTVLHLCCEIALDARGHVIACEARPRTPEAHAAALATAAPCGRSDEPR